MISNADVDDLLWQWTFYKNKEFKHYTGWATRSMSQVMIDVAKVGYLIPSTKPPDQFLQESHDVVRVSESIINAGLNARQNAVLHTKYKIENQLKNNTQLAKLAGMNKSTFKVSLESLKKSIGQQL